MTGGFAVLHQCAVNRIPPAFGHPPLGKGGIKTPSRQKKKRVQSTRLFLCVELLGEVRVDQRGQGLDRLFFIGAVGNDRDGGALHDAEREHTQKTLGIDTPLFLLDPDAAFEFIGLLNKEGRGSGMKADLVVNDYFFRYHSRTPYSLNPYRKL